MAEIVIVVVIALFTATVAGGGLALVRRTVPRDLLAEHTELAGNLYQGIGVIYGVILAFVVIAAWEEYGQAQAVVVDEATAVLNVARIAYGWPNPDRTIVQTALSDYVREAVQVEWPAMAHGDLSPAADTRTLNQIWQALNQAKAVAAVNNASYQAAFAEASALSKARSQRLLLAAEGLPLGMRLVLGIGTIVTIVFTYLFAAQSGRLHGVMIVFFAGLVGLLLLLQYQLQRPYHGADAVPPTALETVLTQIETDAGLPGMTPLATAG
jgi:hypothetical protein